MTLSVVDSNFVKFMFNFRRNYSLENISCTHPTNLSIDEIDSELKSKKEILIFIISFFEI